MKKKFRKKDDGSFVEYDDESRTFTDDYGNESTDQCYPDWRSFKAMNGDNWKVGYDKHTKRPKTARLDPDLHSPEDSIRSHKDFKTQEEFDDFEWNMGLT